MAESSAQPSSSEASVEATKLNASGALATSPTTTQVQKPVDISERPILTPTLDSHDAFLEFCRLYAPYMQYPALTDREVTSTVDAIASLTSRTDENNLLMDPLSTATSNRTENVIPALKERASQLPAVFKSIDLLQDLLAKIRANVDDAQRRVDAAETAAASSLSVTKLFGVFKKAPAEQISGNFKVIDTRAELANTKAAMRADASS